MVEFGGPAGGLGRRRLSFQQPIQSKQKEVFVFSEKELVDAIGSLVIETRNFPGVEKGFFPGKVIKIGKSFTITKTIEIPGECFGLIIDGTNTSLSPSVNGMTAFIINGPFVTLKNLVLGGAFEFVTQSYFGTLVELTGFCNKTTIDNNTIISAQRLVDGRLATDLSALTITGNSCYVRDVPTWVELANCTRGIITNNVFRRFGAGRGVVLLSGCENVIINNNYMNGMTYESSLSDGGNVFVGNSNIGTITAHATDTVWPNGTFPDGTPGFVLTYTADGSPPTWQAAGGGGGGFTATTLEVDLGSALVSRGKFTITDASINATKKLLVWQAPGPYTGKGTLPDEAEMSPIEILSAVPAAGFATVTWRVKPLLTMSPILMDGKQVVPTATAFGTNRDLFQAKLLGLIRGNVKFNYSIGS